MSEFRGYKGQSFELLKKSNIKVGDSIKIITDLAYEGILMPRFEHYDDKHIVVKLKSGYNVGLKVDEINQIERLGNVEPKKDSKIKMQNDSSLPKILLLSTGGTIASKIDYRTGAVTPILTASELYESVPELSKIANFDTRVIFSEYSENLQPEHWEEIAKTLDKYHNSSYSGIIIAHGTDTMQYTAAFLSFAVSGFPIPIALVGSQRSSDRPSSDAAMNLIYATKFLLNTKTRGVFVVMHHDDNDEVIACHLGTRVRKNHTSKRSAFKTIGADPGFLIMENKLIRNFNNNFFKSDEYTPKLKVDTRVALIKYHPGFNPNFIDHIIDSGYQAIIFEGTGLGHVGKTMYKIIKKAHDKGMFLGMTSQCIDGRVSMNVYESGRDLLNLGVVPLGNMIPETALVKAMWSLGNADSKELKNLMLKNIASEFSD